MDGFSAIILLAIISTINFYLPLNKENMKQIMFKQETTAFQLANWINAQPNWDNLKREQMMWEAIQHKKLLGIYLLFI